MNLLSKPLLLMLACVSPLSAGTSSEIPLNNAAPAETDDWTFRSAMYVWGQALDGDVGIGRLNADVNVDFKDILEDLDIAAMGVFEVGRGRWSVLADLSYAEISDSVSPFPKLPSRSVNFEQKQFLGNFLLIYQLLQKDSMKLDVFAGTRVNWLDVDIDAGPGFSRDKAWADPLIGARFEAPVGEDFFFRALGDVGGFGVASDLTWQTIAGFGWRFSATGDVLLGYRAIGTDYQDGNFSYDVTAHGPVLGLEFKF